MIKIDSVSKSFGDKLVLDGINLTLKEPTIYGLVGINGSGKSTLLRIIAGIYRPDQGRVTIDGEDVLQNPEKAKSSFFFLNDLWISFFHFLYPKRVLGYSEYGAEGMPNLHSPKPKRFDNTEEYQCLYHEHLLECFKRHPYLWATHVWNMFDFGSDGRDQGGDPGKNHKGLVTFDRAIKKDAFYLYKAYWSDEKFLHLCGKRYVNRHERKTEIKVYTTLGQVTLFHDGKKVETKTGDKIIAFHLPLHEGKNEIAVSSGDFREEMTINKIALPDDSYKVHSGNSMSWEKKKKEGK